MGTGERMVVLDVLRGVAGILVVNMPFVATPGIVDPDFLTRELPGAVDRAARWLVTFLAEGKFYPLFSFLFGYGFAVQLSRDAPGSPRRRYVRRLAGLLLLGLAHVTLLWAGDILAIYAVLGSRCCSSSAEPTGHCSGGPALSLSWPSFRSCSSRW
ncbi:MAG: hypothetical protein ACR2NV_13555 [Thermoleophilaceae bacterium]